MDNFDSKSFSFLLALVIFSLFGLNTATDKLPQPASWSGNEATDEASGNLKAVQNAQSNIVRPSYSGLSVVNPPVANFDIASQVNNQLQAQTQQYIPQSNPQPGQTVVRTNNVESPRSSPVQAGAMEDPVTRLDYSTINDMIINSQTANFVYFNANFNLCRYCHKFFTTWQELAFDISWWRPVIRLFEINCSDEDNIETCRRAGVTQFPQVRYYWIMSRSLEQDGQRMRVLGKSVHAMRHLVMDKVIESYMENNKLLSQRLKSPGGLTIPLGNLANQQQTNSLSALLGPITQLFGGNIMSQNDGVVNALMGTLSSPPNAGPNPSEIATGSDTLMNGILSGLTAGSITTNSKLLQLLSVFLSDRSNQNAKPLPSNWPELDPIEVSDTQQLLDALPLDPLRNVGALLIMETQEYLHTGPEVILDLCPYNNQTYIARVRDEMSSLSKNLTRRDDVMAPALIYISPSREQRLIMTAPKYSNDEDLRRAFVREYERRYIKYPVKRVWSIPIGSESANRGVDGSNSQTSVVENQEDKEILARLNQVYMDDLTNALRSSLMEQVFRHPDLSDDQYNALVRYIYILINYFPFKDDESLRFIKRLHSWLQNQVSPIDINEYKKQFHDIDDVIPKKEWVACRSLSSAKPMPNSNRKSTNLLDSTAQIGKVVSNITRILRNNHQQTSKIKSLLGAFASPVLLTSQNKTMNLSQRNKELSTNQLDQTAVSSNQPITATPSAPPLPKSTMEVVMSYQKPNKTEPDSALERIFKGLTNGSLGSDTSILKLISSALSGDGNPDSVKSKFAREYPCGAWKLAHVMVANEYIKDSPRKDVKHIVLYSLYQYMLNLYACPTCGNRVSDVSGEFRLNLEEHLRGQGDSVLLLWKVHNRVNKRLESEPRPGSPAKVQFPSKTLCPKCRVYEKQTDFASTPDWHERQVLNFLVHSYRPQSIIINSNLSDPSSSSISHIRRPGSHYNLLLFGLMLLAASYTWTIFSRHVSFE